MWLFFTQHHSLEIPWGCWVYQRFVAFYWWSFSMVWMDHSLTIHLLKDICVVSSFELLWINLLWWSLHRFLCEHKFECLLQMPKSAIAGFHDNCTVSFTRNLQVILQHLYHFSFLPAIYEWSSFSVSLSAFDVVAIFHFSYFEGK